MTRVQFVASARGDLRSAREHYAEENPIAARRFMEEVVRGLRLIREAPLRWPRIDDTRRRLVLTEFPFSIVYRFFAKNDVVRIVAVSHHRRRPRYWSRR